MNVIKFFFWGLMVLISCSDVYAANSVVSVLDPAAAVATPDNNIPLLELATTYEWSQQPDKAKSIYEQLLRKNPNLRPALLGSANVGIAQNRLQHSTAIYRNLLRKNPQDVDALNGLGRVNLVEKKYSQARSYFKRALSISPKNKDAQSGLEQLKKAEQSVTQVPAIKSAASSCADEGLKLLSEPCPPMCEIERILARCDQEDPNNVQVLLLHGLFARKLTLDCKVKFYVTSKKDYRVAICWLKRAVAAAEPDNKGPLLELAVTYEWAYQPEKARAIYLCILSKEPDNRAALFGLASTARARDCYKEASCIYRKFLCENPNDVEALVGMASIASANKKFACACKYYKTAQCIQPDNNDVTSGLISLRDATRYTLTVSQGQYGINDTQTTPNRVYSDSSALNFIADLNATDKLLIFLAHNTKEIQLSQFVQPTFLPKNRAFVGFQRQYSERYGWGVGYDHREHVNLPTEHHLEINGNVYPCTKLQLFGGFRESFPSPFNYQLYWAGFTWFTDLPFNFSTTAYQGIQQIPEQGAIHSPAYSFDFSKELADKTYYDLGVVYLPEESKKWAVHANFVIPTCRNQALVAWHEYYAFNKSYYAGMGYRFYW